MLTVSESQSVSIMVRRIVAGRRSAVIIAESLYLIHQTGVREGVGREKEGERNGPDMGL